MLEAIAVALDELAAGAAPLLLLSSSGRHFSTGYAVGEIPEEIFHRDPGVRASHPFEQVMEKLVHYPAPVVAAVISVDDAGGLRPELAYTLGVKLRVPAPEVERAKAILEPEEPPEG